MKISIQEMATARENIEKVLEEIGLKKFVFEVEPTDDQWQIIIECNMNSSWERIQCSADKEYLLRGIDDAIAHAVLLDNIKEALYAES